MRSLSIKLSAISYEQPPASILSSLPEGVGEGPPKFPGPNDKSQRFFAACR
jgi:hypothetical protein